MKKLISKTDKTKNGQPIEIWKYSTHWMLRIEREGKPPFVHTGSETYIEKIKQEYISGVR